jgi:predicted lipid-binding transport protein (Tim44 family)
MKRIISILAVVAVTVLLAADWMDSAEARIRSGGRSFGGNRSFSRSTTPQRPPSMGPSLRPSSPLGGAFGRGVAGGLLGGFIGNMLFGAMAHGSGMGGFGGSGIGLLELLLLAGLAYFLFKKFARPPAAGPPQVPGRQPPARGFGDTAAPPPVPDAPPEDPLVAGVRQIWQVDDSFDPDGFKETAQDLFFRIQAGWTHRDTALLRDLVGDQLLNEYERHFAAMRRDGRLNRLENIAVRQVELAAAGVEGNEIFVTVRFTANLLDYTVDEKTGEVVEGDRESPVKFQEEWTFAHPVGRHHWKLEGVAE